MYREVHSWHLEWYSDVWLPHLGTHQASLRTFYSISQNVPLRLHYWQLYLLSGRLDSGQSDHRLRYAWNQLKYLRPSLRRSEQPPPDAEPLQHEVLFGILPFALSAHPTWGWPKCPHFQRLAKWDKLEWSRTQHQARRCLLLRRPRCSKYGLKHACGDVDYDRRKRGHIQGVRKAQNERPVARRSLHALDGLL